MVRPVPRYSRCAGVEEDPFSHRSRQGGPNETEKPINPERNTQRVWKGNLCVAVFVWAPQAFPHRGGECRGLGPLAVRAGPQGGRGPVPVAPETGGTDGHSTVVIRCGVPTRLVVSDRLPAVAELRLRALTCPATQLLLRAEAPTREGLRGVLRGEDFPVVRSGDAAGSSGSGERGPQLSYATAWYSTGRSSPSRKRCEAPRISIPTM